LAVNYYSYQSGNWNVATNWTQDPSGTTLVGSAIPGNTDNVTILNGDIITMPGNNITVASLFIEEGGTLDLVATTGHNFGTVTGQGLLRINSFTFPAGNFTAFVAAGGGTVEYYDIASGTLPEIFTYNNLVLSNSTATAREYFFYSDAPTTYTINGNFTVLNTGAGAFTVTIGTANKIATFDIYGNVTISTNSTIRNNATKNAKHQFNCFGDFINNGTVDFWSSNLSYILVSFKGASNNTFACNGSTRLYNIEVNKDVSYNYTLHLTSSVLGNLIFEATGGDLLLITNGALRLGSNINLPRISFSTPYVLGTATNNPCLWIDGATVSMDASELQTYGKIRVSSGSFSINGGAGLVMRSTAEYQQEGGEVSCFQLMPDVTTGHRGSFNMSGGTMRVNGSGGDNQYARFSLPHPGQSFIMSGGSLIVSNATSNGVAVNGGIMIACDIANCSVTGGTVVAEINTDTDFHVATTAPFYNFEVKKTGGTGTCRLDGIKTSSADLAALPITVLANFTIESANNPLFNANNQNVYIGGDFNIKVGGTYVPGINTTCLIQLLKNVTLLLPVLHTTL